MDAHAASLHRLLPFAGKAQWYQALVELAAVMEALLHRDTLALPDALLLAEDTFLKLVLADKTAVVESDGHPYDRSNMEGEIHVPGAEGLQLRFDRQCSTEMSDALEIVAVMPNGATQRVEMLHGCFGGCSLHIPSGTFRYRFPVPQKLARPHQPPLTP